MDALGSGVFGRQAARAAKQAEEDSSTPSACSSGYCGSWKRKDGTGTSKACGGLTFAALDGRGRQGDNGAGVATRGVLRTADSRSKTALVEKASPMDDDFTGLERGVR